MTPTLKRKTRCAVYCRKSSEEGLEQEFNSLDAQRDAGLAYIESQRHDGWIAIAIFQRPRIPADELLASTIS